MRFPSDTVNPAAIVMIVETGDPFELTTEKNIGLCTSCASCPSAGNPINFATGNKYEIEMDFSLSGPGLPLKYSRYYSSQSLTDATLGYGWTGDFSEHIEDETDKLVLHEADGREVYFYDDGQGGYLAESDDLRKITPVSGGGWTMRSPSGMEWLFDDAGRLTLITDRNGNTQTLFYDANDRLYTVADNFGRTLTFSYNTDGRLQTLTTPIGSFTFVYTGNNLTQVIHPDTKSRQYLYEDVYDEHNLTGIINENGVQYVSFTYDDQDRATSSKNTGDMQETVITYSDGADRQVTDGRNNTTGFTLDDQFGIGRVVSSTGSGCTSCPSSSGKSFTFDSRYRIETATDAEGGVTAYTYDDRGNIETLTQAQGSADDERTTSFTWHASYNLPLTVTRPSVSGGTVMDEYAYDTAGNLLTLTENKNGTTERTTTFTWNTSGQMESIDGPRTDVTDTVTFTYYPNDSSQGLNRGMLYQITNAEGHVTTFSQYNGFGKPEQAEDANNVITTYAYDGRGRMTSQTTSGVTTGYTYDDAGRLTKITLPGNRKITYTYTDANLLEKITDNAGNSISYTYDDAGNQTREEIKDTSGTLAAYTDFTYDTFNRLDKIIYPGTGSPYEQYGYDGNDNPVSSRDGNGKITGYAYDVLQRVKTLTRPGNIATGYSYDSSDNLTGVTDAASNNTVYTYDDAGNLKTAASPDAGNTSYGHDDAGNVKTRTDANNIITTYQYDVLNRLTAIQFPNGSQNIGFGYDSGTNGTGRMTSATDPAGSIAIAYNALGQVTQEARVTDGQPYTTVYSYDGTSADLTGMTYPSGLALVFSRDDNGQISGITADGNALISGVTYKPFGPLNGMTAGALNITRTFDQRYLMNGIQAGSVMNLTYTHDGAGNVKTISGIARTPLSPGVTDYNHTANRLDSSTGKVAKTYTHDDAGNIISDVGRTFVYNQNNRLIQVTEGTTVIAEYAYDGFGRRVKKTVGSDVVHYHYDLNGLLISETDGSGSPIRDYVYLNGEPIAMKVYGGPDAWYYFLNDHLGTPQKMVDSAGDVVWEAGYLPFGEARLLVADIENNLRFPGQYYDAETGLHYNWNRYYDPETGRYLRADPIGLEGGINLYAYVQNNPVNYFDLFGLEKRSLTSAEEAVITSAISKIDSYGFNDEAKAIKYFMESGQIKVDTDLSDNGALGEAGKLFSAIYLDDSLFNMDLNLYVTPILAHEYAHLYIESSLIIPMDTLAIHGLGWLIGIYDWEEYPDMVSQIMLDKYVDSMSDCDK